METAFRKKNGRRDNFGVDGAEGKRVQRGDLNQ